MRKLWRRWFKPLDLSTFAHTGHWLRGVALFDWHVREYYEVHIRKQLNDPNALWDSHTKHLEAHNFYRRSLSDD